MFVGKKPPDDIIVKARLNESRYLKPENFKSKNINIVKNKYKVSIFINCFIDNFYYFRSSSTISCCRIDG